MERSVVLVKPDGVQRGLVGEIIHRFERKGLKLVGLKMISLNDAILDEWYVHHKDKPFFGGLKSYMKSYPVVAMLWEGKEVVVRVRELCGPTNSMKAPKGTIRGDFGTDIQQNAIHASEDEPAAKREMDLMFLPHEIFEYKK